MSRAGCEGVRPAECRLVSSETGSTLETRMGDESGPETNMSLAYTGFIHSAPN